jgi:transposase-like protein
MADDDGCSYNGNEHRITIGRREYTNNGDPVCNQCRSEQIGIERKDDKAHLICKKCEHTWQLDYINLFNIWFGSF